MQVNADTLNQILQVLVQIVVVIGPPIVAFLIRNYVRNTSAEKQVAAIVRLANVGIDFIENMDKNGTLNLPDGVKKGAFKLQKAGEWLEEELARQGIKITTDEAQKWIASQFQQRVGEIQPAQEMTRLTSQAADTVLALEQANLLPLPPDLDRITYLAGLIADRVFTILSPSWASVPRERLIAAARAELLSRLQNQLSLAQPTSPLMSLAAEGGAFLQQIKNAGRLSVPPGAKPEDVEHDLVLAWLLTESAKRGLNFSSEQLEVALEAQLSGGISPLERGLAPMSAEAAAVISPGALAPMRTLEDPYGDW